MSISKLVLQPVLALALAVLLAPALPGAFGQVAPAIADPAALGERALPASGRGAGFDRGGVAEQDAGPKPPCEDGVGCQPPLHVGDECVASSGVASDRNIGVRAADNFEATLGGSVSKLCWWGLYLDPGPPAFDCGPGTGDSFAVTYYHDDAGGLIPGSLWAGPLPLTLTAKFDTGFDANNQNEWQFEGTHDPVALSQGGCYWVEIVNSTTATCFWIWRTAAPGDGNFALDGGLGYEPVDSVPCDLAFCLDVAIEPDGCLCVVVPYGDVNSDGEANLIDLLCLLEGLSGTLDCAGVVDDDLDIAPCGGNGDLDLRDLVSMLDSLGGAPPCPDPCQ